MTIVRRKGKSVPKSSKATEKMNMRLSGRLQRGRSRIKRRLSLTAVLPNITTVLALCTGLSSVRFALMNRWNLAVMAILVAAVLDAMDGRLARYLGSASRFGAELDSLSDFVSFGVSPAVVLYLHTLYQWEGFGWAIVLSFAVCSALRLARFNTMSIEGTVATWAQGFFTGVPAPAAAILSLMFIMMHLKWGYTEFLHPALNAIIVVTVAILMVSRVPTFSLKKIYIPHKWLLPLLLIVALLTVALFSDPWLVLSCITIGYVLTIPFSIIAYRKLAKEQHQGVDQELTSKVLLSVPLLRDEKEFVANLSYDRE